MQRGLRFLACLCFLGGCAHFAREPLSVTIAEFNPVEIGVLEQRYDIKVRLLNPNDTEIAFDGVAFDLEINGQPFAKGVSDQKGVVPRFGEAVIAMKVVSGLGSFLRQIGELQKQDRVGLSYRIKGRLNSGEGFWFTQFNTAGEFLFPTGEAKPGK